MAVVVYDRWHKSRPKPDEPKCKEHKLVPSKAHGQGERWQVRWDVWIDGKRHQPKRNFSHKVGKDPEKHADAFVIQIQTELNAPSEPESPQIMRLRDIGQEWLNSRNIAESSMRTLTSRVTNHILCDGFGDLEAFDLYEDPNLIQQWLKGLGAKGLAQTTQRELRANLSSILKFAFHKKVIPANPVPHNPLISTPKPDRKTIVPYTPEQLADISANLRQHYHPVVKAGSEAGLRIGEIWGLSPDDIVEDDLHIRRQVRENNKHKGGMVFALPKGRKTRTVPLPHSLKSFLLGLPTTTVTLPWDKVSGPPVTVRVFMGRNGRLRSYSALSLAWDTALAKAGIVRVPYEDKYHKLRHTYASRLLRRGVDIRSLALYLGHDDPAFTLSRYCHFMIGTGDDVRRAIDGDVPDV
ncbi:tyrosine-type recombinase/integrase [Nonomuraea sp. NPDC050451]|uniref:tyrosine-type recombinase/integrase n=1 Tax=Nonomuraea sp. NPDC050451 TaxID=3364364 RepID=UPI00378B1904